LKREGAAAKNTRTIVRSDVRIHRKLLRAQDHPNRDGNLRSSVLYKRIEEMLAPHHGFSVIGFGPNGMKVPGNTTLNTWRSMPSKPTHEQINNVWLRREEIKGLVNRAHTMIADLDEGIEDSEQKIPQALIQALLENFGNSHVKDALVELRLI
jgi:hypothetical protein